MRGVRSRATTGFAMTKFVIDFDHDGYPSRCAIDACDDGMPDSEHVLCAYSGVALT
jgi:hypothetical protein